MAQNEEEGGILKIPCQPEQGSPRGDLSGDLISPLHYQICPWPSSPPNLNAGAGKGRGPVESGELAFKEKKEAPMCSTCGLCGVTAPLWLASSFQHEALYAELEKTVRSLLS